MTGKNQWNLIDHCTGKILSDHPNIEGAKLSALFHIANGDNITWHKYDGPVQVAAERGFVNSQRRFTIQAK